MLWKDEYCLGVEHIDQQHKGLFTVANRIVSIVADRDSDRNRRACREAIKYLKNYCIRHFADEEEYQRSIGYARYEQHKAEHERFTESILELEQELEREDFSSPSVQKLMGTLSSWLIHHIMFVDQTIVALPVENSAQVAAHEQDAAAILQNVLEKEASTLFHHKILVKDAQYAGSYTGSENLLLAECGLSDGRQLRAIAAFDALFSRRLAQAIMDTPMENMQTLADSTLTTLLGLVITQFVRRLYGEAGGIQLQKLSHRELTPVLLQQEQLCSLLFSSPFGSMTLRINRPV